MSAISVDPSFFIFFIFFIYIGVTFWGLWWSWSQRALGVFFRQDCAARHLFIFVFCVSFIYLVVSSFFGFFGQECAPFVSFFAKAVLRIIITVVVLVVACWCCSFILVLVGVVVLLLFLLLFMMLFILPRLCCQAFVYLCTIYLFYFICIFLPRTCGQAKPSAGIVFFAKNVLQCQDCCQAFLRRRSRILLLLLII